MTLVFLLVPQRNCGSPGTEQVTQVSVARLCDASALPGQFRLTPCDRRNTALRNQLTYSLACSRKETQMLHNGGTVDCSASIWHHHSEHRDLHVLRYTCPICRPTPNWRDRCIYPLRFCPDQQTRRSPAHRSDNRRIVGKAARRYRTRARHDLGRSSPERRVSPIEIRKARWLDALPPNWPSIRHASDGGAFGNHRRRPGIG